MSYLSFRSLRALFTSPGRLPLSGNVRDVLQAVVLAGVVGATAGAHAQSAASISGRALDANGLPMNHAVIRLVSDPTTHGGTWRYTLMGDALGKFNQEGLAPGTYLVMLSTGGQATDVLESVRLHAGEAVQLELRPGQRNGLRAMAGSTAGLWTGAKR